VVSTVKQAVFSSHGGLAHGVCQKLSLDARFLSVFSR